MKKSLPIYFDSHYKYIVEITSNIKRETISSTSSINFTDETELIVNQYKDHPSIKLIKNKIMPENNQKQVIFF